MTAMDNSSSSSNGHRDRGGLRRLVLPVKLPQPVNPALVKQAEERTRDIQNRIADKITTFAGSMTFVYLHIIWFASWIGFGVEKYPYGLLTMIVSLEAIFLSTFVMISQNRADAKRQAIADEEWKTVQIEDQQNNQLIELSKKQDAENEELIELSKRILALTEEVRGYTARDRQDASAPRTQT